jgi:hypothetical protein
MQFLDDRHAITDLMHPCEFPGRQFGVASDPTAVVDTKLNGGRGLWASHLGE